MKRIRLLLALALLIPAYEAHGTCYRWCYKSAGSWYAGGSADSAVIPPAAGCPAKQTCSLTDAQCAQRAPWNAISFATPGVCVAMATPSPTVSPKVTPIPTPTPTPTPTPVTWKRCAAPATLADISECAQKNATAIADEGWAKFLVCAYGLTATEAVSSSSSPQNASAANPRAIFTSGNFRLTARVYKGDDASLEALKLQLNPDRWIGGKWTAGAITNNPVAATENSCTPCHAAAGGNYNGIFDYARLRAIKNDSAALAKARAIGGCRY